VTSLSAFLVLASLALAAPCFGQDPAYSTWDQFFYKVEVPVKAATPESEVNVFVYHSYPTPLHDVGAVGSSDSLAVTRQPAVMEKLAPTEIASFAFAVQGTGAAGERQASLTVTLSAKELPGSKPIELAVPLTPEAEQELQEQQAVPVGSMEVRIGGWGNQVYLLYLLPTVGLLGWMMWRRRRLARL
jgi:hypothetical protein